MLAADIAFNSSKSGSLEFKGDSTFSIARANTALLFGLGNITYSLHYTHQFQFKPNPLTIIPYFEVVDVPHRMHRTQQLFLVLVTARTEIQLTGKNQLLVHQLIVVIHRLYDWFTCV